MSTAASIESFLQVMRDYPIARATPRHGAHEVNRALGRVRELVEGWLIARRGALEVERSWKVRASTGRGRSWANVCWAAVMHQVESDTPEDGRYICWLFDAEGRHVALALAWGTTAFRRAHRDPDRSVSEGLAARRASQAERLRQELEAPGWRIDQDLDLAATTQLARDYERSMLAYKTYSRVEELSAMRGDFEELLEGVQGDVQRERLSARSASRVASRRARRFKRARSLRAISSPRAIFVARVLRRPERVAERVEEIAERLELGAVVAERAVEPLEDPLAIGVEVGEQRVFGRLVIVGAIRHGGVILVRSEARCDEGGARAMRVIGSCAASKERILDQRASDDEPEQSVKQQYEAIDPELRALVGEVGEALEALDERHVHAPHISPLVLAEEAVALVDQVQGREDLSAPLEELSIDEETFETVRRTARLCRELEQRWKKRQGAARQGGWSEVEKRAQLMRAELIAASRYHMRYDAHMLHELDLVQQGEGAADLILDLDTLARFIKGRGRCFKGDPRFKVDERAERARAMAQELRRRLGDIPRDTRLAELRTVRTRAFSLLSFLVFEIRQAGLYRFWGDASRSKVFGHSLERDLALHASLGQEPVA